MHALLVGTSLTLSWSILGLRWDCDNGFFWTKYLQVYWWNESINRKSVLPSAIWCYYYSVCALRGLRWDDIRGNWREVSWRVWVEKAWQAGLSVPKVREYTSKQLETINIHSQWPHSLCRGESYLDVIARLEPIIIEMERHREPLLIIGHQVSGLHTL